MIKSAQKEATKKYFKKKISPLEALMFYKIRNSLGELFTFYA